MRAVRSWAVTSGAARNSVPYNLGMTPAVGIDLGTTNSLAAVVVDGRPQVLRDPAGAALVPSCLHLPPGARRGPPSPMRNSASSSA